MSERYKVTLWGAGGGGKGEYEPKDGGSKCRKPRTVFTAPLPIQPLRIERDTPFVPAMILMGIVVFLLGVAFGISLVI